MQPVRYHGERRLPGRGLAVSVRVDRCPRTMFVSDAGGLVSALRAFRGNFVPTTAAASGGSPGDEPSDHPSAGRLARCRVGALAYPEDWTC